MAAADHNPSRRALLGAAAALPALAAPGGRGGPRPAPGDEAWREALAAFVAAEAEFTAFERFSQGRPAAEQRALEDGYGDRMDSMYEALRRLLRVPAPDVAALLRKLVLAIDHEVGTLAGGEECLAEMRRDSLRLANALG